MKRSLVCSTVLVGFVSACANASVTFSQPPTPTLNLGWISNLSDRITTPWVATSNAPMTGVCFWGRNGQSNFDTSDNIRIDIFAEAPGGGPGSSLFSGVYPLASFTQESTANPTASKYGFNLPNPISLAQGSRYFLGIAGDEFVMPGDEFHGFSWIAAAGGAPTWISIEGTPYYEESVVTVSFEIKSQVIPLPSGAAMGLAGLSVMAGCRRRRATI